MLGILRPLLTFFVICLFLPGCTRQQTFYCRKLYCQAPFLTPIYPNHPYNASKDWITIWVHGACPFQTNFYNLGLKKPETFSNNDQVYIIAQTLINADNKIFNPDLFYLFSWSGKLDFDERLSAAQQLFRELDAVVSEYKKIHGKNPRIRIFGYSHGANVALNLARVPNHHNISIDELVLLACPVQRHTESLVSNPLFKRVLSIYCTCDIAQVVDPQGLYRDHLGSPLFSGFRFKPSSNLLQVQMMINGYALMHGQFVGQQVLSLMPTILSTLNNWFDTLPESARTSSNNTIMFALYTNGRKPPRNKKPGVMYEHIQMVAHSTCCIHSQ